MSDPKLISPLLDGFVMGPPISSHQGIRCCPAMKQNSDNKYIVKVISIPASQVQLDALLLTGAYKDPGDAMDYFKAQADEITEEATFLMNLSRLEGFLAFDGCQVVPMEDNQLGYHVYLLGSFKRSLDRHMRRNPMHQEDAVKLGIDICTALATCRRAGCVYIALKPTNIFLSDDKEYRIGDLGFVIADSLKYTSLPAKYRSDYCAPEILDSMQTLNDTVDTYALGMILYQICNDGKLPEIVENQPIKAPANASDALSEIILKAICANPDDRWADPVQMGQALVRCLPNKESQPAEPEHTVSEQTQVFSTEEVLSAVSAQPVASDTKVIPVQQIQEHAASTETADTAQTRVIPAAQIRQAVSSETKVIPSAQNLFAVESDNRAAQAPSPVSAETKVIPSVAAVPSASVVALGDKPSVYSPAYAEGLEDEFEDNFDQEEYDEENAEERPAKKPLGKGWILPLISIILLAALGFAGFYYYQNYYLQTIDSMTVEGMYNQLTVIVETDIDESLLSVSCTDTYGNSMQQNLVNGKAEFTNLLPNSQYRIELEIEGFHKLVGKSSDVFNTESRTDIVSFTGITGAEDGSVMLTFTVDGPEPSEWIIHYSAEGEEELTQNFTGHSVTIKDLVVPKTYTFWLTPLEEIYVSGQTSLEFTASALVMAQNLVISSSEGSDMTVRWDSPENTAVESWSVRCYSDDGFEEIVETTENKYVFTGIDPSRAYHVEVTAAGMTQPARTSITANPITVTSFQVDTDEPMKLTVSWDHKGQAPDGGWLLLYSLDGSNTQSVVKCSGTTAEISPRVPGAEYKFVIQAADNTSIFTNIHTFNCPNPGVFEDHSFNTEKVIAYLVVTPEKENWTSADVTKNDYTDHFSVGEEISVILYCPARFYIPEDDISILYVIRNAEGKVITSLISQATDDWHDMWVHYNTSYAELDIPTVPTELGEYSISIYFNGLAVTSTTFTITE